MKVEYAGYPKKRRVAGQFAAVKYRSEMYCWNKKLNREDYGVDKYWVLLAVVKEQTLLRSLDHFSRLRFEISRLRLRFLAGWDLPKAQGWLLFELSMLGYMIESARVTVTSTLSSRWWLSKLWALCCGWGLTGLGAKDTKRVIKSVRKLESWWERRGHYGRRTPWIVVAHSWSIAE